MNKLVWVYGSYLLITNKVTKCLFANRVFLFSFVVLLKVLRLLYHLVKSGLYGTSEDIHELHQPILDILNGKNDLPYPMTEGILCK